MGQTVKRPVKPSGYVNFTGELLTCPSPKPSFCPKWEVSVNVSLGGGVGAQFPRNLNWWSVIFRPIQGLTFIESWFPERSANFIQCYQERILHSRALLVCCHCIILRPVSGKSRQRFAAEKRFHVYRVCIIKDQSFNSFENDTMKLSVNEAKLTGLWARNFTTFNCFWFRNLPSDPRSCRDVRETGPCIVCFEAVARGRFKQSITPRSRNYTSITTFLNDLSGIHIFHLTTYDSLSFPLFLLDIIW